MNRPVPYSEFRNDPDKYMKEARTVPVFIDQGVSTTVLMPAAEFEGWKETLRLLRNPANAKELREAVADAEAGRLKEHGLDD